MPRPSFTWVTTDWHFGHRAMERACGRPHEFEVDIYREHCKAVADQDTVVNLGDLIFYPKDSLCGLIELANERASKNILVLGNHDQKTKTWYRRLGFDVVCDGIIIDGCLLTHRPTTPPPGMLNIHGHWHNLGDRTGESPGYDPARQFCVSLERTDYRPINLQSQLAAMRRPGWVNPQFPYHRKEADDELRPGSDERGGGGSPQCPCRGGAETPGRER